MNEYKINEYKIYNLTILAKPSKYRKEATIFTIDVLAKSPEHAKKILTDKYFSENYEFKECVEISLLKYLKLYCPRLESDLEELK